MAFSGHSAGGETVLSVADRLYGSDPETFDRLKGLVLQDPVKSFVGTNTDDAVASLGPTSLPIYALASPSSPPATPTRAAPRPCSQGLAGRSFVAAEVTTGVHGDIFGALRRPWWSARLRLFPPLRTPPLPRR